MGFYGRFAAAYGTIWLAITVLYFAQTYVHLGDAGLMVLLLGSAVFAVITRPGARLPQPAPAAPIPTATVVRDPGAPPTAPPA